MSILILFLIGISWIIECKCSLIQEATTLSAPTFVLSNADLYADNINFVFVGLGQTSVVGESLQPSSGLHTFVPGFTMIEVGLAANSPPTPSRMNHFSAFYFADPNNSNDMRYFVGYGHGADVSNFYTDIWVLSMLSLVWSRIDPISCWGVSFVDGSANCPAGRLKPGFTTLSRGNSTMIVVHGGMLSTGVHASDMWMFDLIAYTWTSIGYSSSANEMNRTGHAVVYYNNLLYLYGGVNPAASTSELVSLYTFDFVSRVWHKSALSGTTQSGCYYNFPQLYHNFLLVHCMTHNYIFSIDLLGNTMGLFSNHSLPYRANSTTLLLNGLIMVAGDSNSFFSFSQARLGLNTSESFTNEVFPYYAQVAAQRSGHVCALIPMPLGALGAYINIAVIFGGTLQFTPTMSPTLSGPMPVATGFYYQISQGNDCRPLVFTTPVVPLYMTAFLSFNSIFMFGGLSSNRTVLSTLYALSIDPISLIDPYNLQNYTFQMTDYTTQLSSPIPAVYGACAVAVTYGSNSYALVYGGLNQSVIAQNSFFAVNSITFQVYYLTGSLPMYFYGVVVVNQRLIFFYSLPATFWVVTYDCSFDGNGTIIDSGVWTPQATSLAQNSVLADRAGYSCVGFSSSIQNSNYLLVYGGHSITYGTNYNDLWNLNLQTWVWTELVVTNNPRGRSYSTYFFYANFLLISGGIIDQVSGAQADDMPLIFGSIGDVSVDPSGVLGSNYGCLGTIFTPCLTIEFALSSYQDFNGLPQLFGIAWQTSGIAITKAFQIDVHAPVQLIGQAFYNNPITIDCDGYYCMRVSLPSTLANFSVIVSNLIFVNGNNTLGGIINLDSGILSVSGCTFSSSSAVYGGAIRATIGTTLIISSSLFFNLSASQYSGAIFSEFNTLSISFCTFAFNSVLNANAAFSFGGGAVALFSVNASIVNSNFTRNIVSGNAANPAYGGGLYALSSLLTLANCIFDSNMADAGGAIGAQGFASAVASSSDYKASALKSTSNFFVNNVAAISGGAVIIRYAAAQSFFSDTFIGNIAGVGGAIQFIDAAQASIIGTMLSSNIALSGNGGGISASLTPLSIISSSFVNNTASFGGGGGYYWERNYESQTALVPIVSSLTFLNNSAKYGTNFASNYMRISIVNSLTNYPVQQTAHVVSVPLVVVVVDYYNQSVTSLNSGSMALSSSMFSGALAAKISAGTAAFSGLIPYGPNNSSFYFTAYFKTAYDVGQLNTENFLIKTRGCNPGEYDAGVQGCVTCAAGLYSSARMSSTCTQCALGSFSNIVGATACSLCAVGSSASQKGSLSCTKCAISTIQNIIGGSNCTSCPVFSLSSANNSFCYCPSYFYSNLKYSQILSTPYLFNCLNCPAGVFHFLLWIKVGGNCSNPTQASLGYDQVYPLPAYYPVLHNDPDPSVLAFQNCFNLQACVGGPLNQTCLYGYVGVLCASCAGGFDLIASTSQCAPCIDPTLNKIRLSLIAFATLVFFIAFAHLNSRTKENSIASSISQVAVVGLQFNSIANSFGTPFIEPLNSFLSFQGNGAYATSSAFSISCLSNTLYPNLSFVYVTLVMYAILPIASTIIVMFSYYLKYLYEKFADPSVVESQNYWHQATAGAYVVFLFNHPDIVNQVFGVFKCYKVGNGLNDFYLNADMTQQCWTHEHYSWLLILAFPMLIVYVIGVPLSLAVNIYRVSDDLSTPDAALFQFMFLKYRKEFWYWQFLLIFRQVLMIAISVFEKSTGAQSLMAILLCVAMLLGHAFVLPFYDDRVNNFEFFSVFTSFLTYFFASLLQVLDPSNFSYYLTTMLFFLISIAFLLGTAVVFIYFSRTSAKQSLERFAVSYSLVHAAWTQNILP